MTEISHPSDAASALLAWLRERSRWRLGAAATPVDALARLLGLDVATFDAALHPGVWGYLEPGEDLVFLRAGLPDAARRFTLAHEIGHAVLHRGIGAVAEILGARVHAPSVTSATLTTCQSSDVESLDFLSDETLSPGQMYSVRSTVEQEANAFAVALLMPEAPFLEAYLTLCSHAQPTGATRGVTRLLARRFGVSEDAALRRLQWLLMSTKGEETARHTQSALSAIDDLDQQAAARLEAPALVMAGPGSGKTSTLVERIKYLIEERGAKPDEILALTFSRKAAEELRERAGGALMLVDSPVAPYISTIHRFCLDLIERYGTLIGLPPGIRLASELEHYFLLRQVMREAHLHYLSSPFAPDLYVRDIQQMISRAKDDLVGPSEVSSAADSAIREAADEAQRESAARLKEFALIFGDYQRRLIEQRTVDYGDVIALAARLLGERREIAEDVAKRWPYTLVDEYQDINRAMGAVFRELVSAGSGLWAVGDADQAIYRFRGAEPGIVHRFGETFTGAHVVSLVRNYRSRRAILDAASAFAGEFSQTIGRLPLEATRVEVDDTDDACAAVRIASAETSEDELSGLARAIEERHRGGRAYRDQVVLLRTRRQVEQVAVGLGARGIPTYTLASALDRDVVKRCIAVLSLLSEASGAGLIRAGLQPEHAFMRDDAVALLRESRRQRRAPLDLLLSARGVAGVSHAGQVAMRQLGRMLSAIRSVPSVATGICLYCFSFTRIGARLLMDRERSAVDAASLRRLLDLARAFDSWQMASADAPTMPDSMVDWDGFADFLRAASLLRLDTLDEIPGQGVDMVRVMTAHASKGLEFPAVYLPQLVNRRFPLTGRAPVVSRVGQTSDSSVRKDEGLSDEASLFYVAMTRARDELILSNARRYGRASYTVSPFLGPIEQAMGGRAPHEQWVEASEADGPTPIAVDESAPPQSRLDESGALFDLAELETYQRCPKQYAYRYVDNLWSSASFVSLYSRVTRRASHTIMRAFTRSRQQGKAFPSHDEALASVEELWRAILEEDRADSGGVMGLRNATLEGYYLRQAKATIEKLWMSLNQHERGAGGSSALIGETLAGQATISVSNLQIRGEIETISISSNSLGGEMVSTTGKPANPQVIVRYRNSQSDTSPTLRDLFAEIVAQGDVKDSGQGRVIARNLATGTIAPVNLTARQRTRLTREALEAASGIMRGDFHANPDEWQCQRCPFAAACPE